MRAIAIGLAALLMTAGAASAAEPWKTGESSLGKVYTNAKGMTLYSFDKDKAGESSCYDQCASNWPPFKAARRAKPTGEWTVVTRKDGSHMWAHGGKPLYTFAKDKKPGDVTGDGVGGVWHAAKAQ